MFLIIPISPTAHIFIIISSNAMAQQGGLSPEAAEFDPRRTDDDSPGGLSPEVAELDSRRTDDDSPPGFFSRHLPRQPRQPRYWPKHFFSDKS